MVEPSAHQLVQRLLTDRTYHIEYHGYLTNHAKHAVVALHGLGTSEQRIEEYWNEYTTTVPYGFKLEPFGKASITVTADTWLEYRGTKTDYPALCNFFADQVSELGMDEAVRRFAPALVAGCAGGLTHGIIHLGWALDRHAESAWMLVEGLAYMAYTFVSVHPERFQHGAHRDSSPLASLLRAARTYESACVAADVQQIKDAPEFALERGFHAELYEAGFQWQLAKVLEAGHPLFLQLPSWLDEVDLGSSKALESALEPVYKAMTIFYLVTSGQPDASAATSGSDRRGNFVVLHLITSLWGAEQIMRRLSDAPARRDVLKCYWSAALAVAMTSASGLPRSDAVEGTWRKFEAAHDPANEDDAELDQAEGGTWSTIVRSARAEEEEHNMKLAYVERELWRRYQHWTAFRVAAATFTPMPNIGPGKGAYRA